MKRLLFDLISSSYLSTYEQWDTAKNLVAAIDKNFVKTNLSYT